MVGVGVADILNYPDLHSEHLVCLEKTYKFLCSYFSFIIYILQETIPGFHDFSEAFHRYNNYLKKLVPYFVLR